MKTNISNSHHWHIPALLLFLLPTALWATTRTWDGGGTDSLASNPINWDGDTAPIQNDAIILDATSHKNMTWNMTNMTMASWTQAGYTGTVTITTVYGTTGFTNFNITGNCIVSNGTWTHTANPAVNYEVNRLNATIGGDLIVGSDAMINVAGKGYGAGRGPGKGGASSYGGRGNYYNDPASSGPCYGSIVAPANLGSGGTQSAGGGAIFIAVAGTLYLDGTIDANGNPSTYYTGAGGSVFITTGALIGNGAIQVIGGTSTGGVGPGGGGRISLTVTNANADFSGFSGANVAYGGRFGAGTSRSGAGTVYLCEAGQGLDGGTLIVDNNNAPTIVSSSTVVNSQVTDTIVGNVFIKQNGFLLLDTNQTLTVSGIWSNTARFEGYEGSAVIFTGPAASTSIFYGATSFLGLICTNTNGKTLVFHAGSTNTIAAQGRLTLLGCETTTNLVLRSTIDGVAWKLKANPSALQSIWFVNVRDSDASSGATVVAMNSRDGGANTNWSFVTPVENTTNVWTGASNTMWS